ncbi:MAG: acyl carrier protein [Bdellovibrionales bacterium]
MSNPQNLQQIQEQIKAFLQGDAFYEESVPRPLDDDFKLLQAGALDSLGILNLIVFIEKQFNMQIRIEDMSEANFGDVRRIAKFVSERTQHGS